MALNNGVFKGIIDGKSAKDYPNPDGSILKLENRIKYIEKIFNLDKYGISKDEYILNIWDSGCNTVHLNKNNMLWTDTKTAQKFERYGTYLINCSTVNKNRTCEPKTLELSPNISNEDVDINDKNYRLSPKEDIYKADYRLPKQFRGTYDDYLNIHKNNMDKLEKKFEEYNKDRYGYDDGLYIYSKDTLITEEQWVRWKNKYLQKIQLLEGVYNDYEKLSYHDLYDILRKQMSVVRSGNKLQYNKREIVHIKINECDIPLSKQLVRMDLNPGIIRKIEDNCEKLTRTTNVTLTHVRDNIASVKDMGVSTKLAYSPRIMINPSKCSANNISLEDIDYCNKMHVYGMLKLPKTEPNSTNQLSILSYDLYNMIDKLHNIGKLSDRDLYILEGIRYNIPQKDLARELGVNQSVVSRLTKRIIKTITDGFIEDKEDLIYLNKYKGKYKKCSKCGENKLISYFNKNSRRSDGCETFCKECK